MDLIPHFLWVPNGGECAGEGGECRVSRVRVAFPAFGKHFPRGTGREEGGTLKDNSNAAATVNVVPVFSLG